MEENRYKEWLEKHNLQKNPFILEINPSLFVGYRQQISNLINNIKQQQKLILLSGPTGSGKTTIITYLKNQNCDYVYLNKPPKKTNELIDLADYFIKDLGLLKRIITRKPKKINDLPSFLDKIITRHKVLFIDEAHEASIEVLEWLRVMVDHVKNLTFVFSALPVFDEILTKHLETLKKRITKKIELTALTKEETEELIRKRIKHAGGENIKPFSYNTIEYIYSRTGGFPRDIILLCNELFNIAVERNSDIIDYNLIKENNKNQTEISIKIDNLKHIPDKQKIVIDIIAKNEPITPKDLIPYFKEYQSNKHALRAINNLLGRLIKQGFVEREKTGKSYSYKLSPSTRTILVRG